MRRALAIAARVVVGALIAVPVLVLAAAEVVLRAVEAALEWVGGPGRLAVPLNWIRGRWTDAGESDADWREFVLMSSMMAGESTGVTRLYSAIKSNEGDAVDLDDLVRREHDAIRQKYEQFRETAGYPPSLACVAHEVDTLLRILGVETAAEAIAVLEHVKLERFMTEYNIRQSTRIARQFSGLFSGQQPPGGETQH